MRKIAIPFVMSIFLLSACAEPELKEGRVVGKQYFESYVNVTTECIEAYEDGSCSMTGEVLTEVPECYKIVFEADGKRGESCVSKEQYDSINMNDEFKK